jgi:hypothetical protein
MSSSSIRLKIAGLQTTANSLGSVPEGALVEASNIVIDKNDVVESRRGFKLYGSLTASSIEQGLNYKDIVLRHFGTSLEYDSSVTPGTFTKYQELVWKYASSLTRSGVTATFTSIKPHGLAVGDTVVISGSNLAQYNGTFTVLASGFTSTVFKYTMASDPGASSAGTPVIETRTANVAPVDSSNKIRGYEAVNSNFYFTSSKGVRRLSAINGFLVNAGAIKALDVSLASVAASTSPVLLQNSQLGYRTLWGYKDTNNNIFYGSPSTRNTIGLTIADLIIPDFNTLLGKIDAAATANGAATDPNNLSQTNYYSTLNIATTASASALNVALRALASKLELDMVYTSGGTVSYQNPRYGRSGSITATTAAATTTITSNAHGLTNGSIVVISGSNTVPSIDGEWTISGIAANTFVIPVTTTAAGSTGTWTSGIARNYPTFTTDTAQDYLDQQAFFDEIVDALLGEPIAKVTAAAQTAGSFDNSTQGKNVDVTLSVPEGVTPSHFYQIYRTTASAGSDVDPGDDMGLVYEGNPTAAEIIAGTITITDDTTDDFRGADLYTNPRQEGILQANEPPPWAKDITIYKNMMFYANTKTLQKKQISLFGTAGLSGTTITIAGVAYTFAGSENTATGQVEYTPLSAFTAIDTYVTGFTYNPASNTFTIKQNQGQADLPNQFTTVSGLTLSNLINSALQYRVNSRNCLYTLLTQFICSLISRNVFLFS